MSVENNLELRTHLTKKEIWLPLALSLAVVFGIWVGMKLQNEPLVDTQKKKNKLSTADATNIVGQGRMEEILRYVDAKYVDDVNNSVMVDKSINNILQELDPHSVYIPANELQSVSEELEGEFEGVGVETIMLEDTINVITTISDSPASKAGLLTGDKIMGVDDSFAVRKDKRWLNSRFRGKRGTPIKLQILRGGKLLTMTLDRDKIPIQSIDCAVTLDEFTGYVKINRFANSTTREFNQALIDLFEKKAVKNLVLDLRGNPGGYLDKAVDMLSQFFSDKDKLLVFTKGRTVHKNEYKTTGRQRFNIEKIAVLIDEGSASASEIVAGAVQDWDRGVIVGRRSFGKGLVQEPYHLADGAELRLTVARYFTPNGRSIQKPYKNKTVKEYEQEEDLRFERGELSTPDSTFKNATAIFKTSNGRTVYGGGGIAPDIFVPVESYYKNAYYHQLKNWAIEYSYQYYLGHQKEMKFKEWREFRREFKVTDYSFNEFVKYTQRHEVPKNALQINELKQPLKQLIKARIARQMFGDEGYFGILNEDDACVKRAYEALKLDDPLGLRRLAQKK
ncbi:MAG: S41 family peptidase [Saprospiraceae bacterium]|nr:S41 family peptidase [Saprospiraceae bacterium]